MNKTIGIIVLAMALMAVSAMAITPAFEAHKMVSVTGDWKWNGLEWQNGNWETATFAMNAYSNANSGWYTEIETAGDPWKYSLQSQVGFEDDGSTQNLFHSWTVNDPAVTPATGGYTQFSYEQQNQGDYSMSQLLVKGFADTQVTTQFHSIGCGMQNLWLNINEPAED